MKRLILRGRGDTIFDCEVRQEVVALPPHYLVRIANSEKEEVSLDSLNLSSFGSRHVELGLKRNTDLIAQFRFELWITG